MKLLFVITARGGSKGILNKNIIDIAGRPLIAWTIAAARESGLGGRILVSTDSRKIADAAIQLGAEAPFLRPGHLAEDGTPSRDAIIHALDWLEEIEAYCPDYVMLLQPTSPLRSAEDIRGAWELAQRSGAGAVVSMALAQDHPYWCKTLAPDGAISDFLDSRGRSVVRRQELPPVYVLNGAIYLLRTQVLRASPTLCPDGARAYVMPPERSMDIDTPLDLKLADALLTEAMSASRHNV